MKGVTLFRLADAVGVSQYQAAAALGLARTQTNLWAQGKRPIPDAHLPTLLTLVGQAADAALDALDAEPHRLREAFTQAHAQRKKAILALCEDVKMELLESLGSGPSAMVASSLEALSKYAGMSGEELRKGTTPHEVIKETARLTEAVRLWERLEPMQHVLEKHGGEPL